MDTRTKRQIEKGVNDRRIACDFLAELKIGRATTCRIASAMAESGEYGYKSVGGILASLRRTGTIA